MTFDVYGLTAEEAAPYVNANKSKRTGYLTTQFLNANYNYFATETKVFIFTTFSSQISLIRIRNFVKMKTDYTEFIV